MKTCFTHSFVRLIIGLCLWAGLATTRAAFTDSYIIGQAAQAEFRQTTVTYGTWDYTASGSLTIFPLTNIDRTQAPTLVTIGTGSPIVSNTGGAGIRLGNTAVADGVLSFSYDVKMGYVSRRSFARDETYGQWYRVAPNSSDKAGYFINGDQFYLPAGDNAGEITNVALQQGDKFGFFVSAGPASVNSNITSFSTLSISDFTAPELTIPGGGGIAAIPEPSTWVLCGLGAVLSLSQFRRMRKRL